MEKKETQKDMTVTVQQENTILEATLINKRKEGGNSIKSIKE